MRISQESAPVLSNFRPTGETCKGEGQALHIFLAGLVTKKKKFYKIDNWSTFLVIADKETFFNLTNLSVLFRKNGQVFYSDFAARLFRQRGGNAPNTFRHHHLSQVRRRLSEGRRPSGEFNAEAYQERHHQMPRPRRLDAGVQPNHLQV